MVTMEVRKLHTPRQYSTTRRSPENQRLLDSMGRRMMSDQRELRRRMLRGRGGE